jgi:hypothetical protein
MAKQQKLEEWQVISEARRKSEAALRVKLREARLARDATLPPVEPAKPRAPRKKKPAAA